MMGNSPTNGGPRRSASASAVKTNEYASLKKSSPVVTLSAGATAACTIPSKTPKIQIYTIMGAWLLANSPVKQFNPANSMKNCMKVILFLIFKSRIMPQKMRPRPVDIDVNTGNCSAMFSETPFSIANRT